jgi:hypothetical protein
MSQGRWYPSLRPNRIGMGAAPVVADKRGHVAPDEGDVATSTRAAWCVNEQGGAWPLSTL